MCFYRNRTQEARCIQVLATGQTTALRQPVNPYHVPRRPLGNECMTHIKIGKHCDAYCEHLPRDLNCTCIIGLPQNVYQTMQTKR